MRLQKSLKKTLAVALSVLLLVMPLTGCSTNTGSDQKVPEKEAPMKEAENWAEESFFEGLKFCKKGYRIGDVSHAIQSCVEAAGFSVIRDYTGHGVGRDLHEDPPVLNYGKAGHGPKLVPGMTLAIEPMIAAGDYDVDVLDNDWTVVMSDGSMCAHYENSVVITEGEPILLTCRDRAGY